MVTVYVAAYNKGPYLESVVRNLIRASKIVGKVKLDIIIVDDGSFDNTKEVVKRLKKKYSFVRSIHHRVNQGLGVGFTESVSIAKYPKFLYISGDNDANLPLIVKLLRYRNMADLVLAYYLNKEIRPRFRNFLSTFYGMIYMFTFDVYIQYFNGVGMYSVDHIKKIILRSTRFSITAELNTKLLCSGCTYYEVAGYQKLDVGKSNAFSIKNFWEVITTYFKLIYDITIAKRNFYNKKPVRIYNSNF